MNIRDAIRNGADVYGPNGIVHVRSDVCNRTFVLYIQGRHNVQTCARFLRGYCYRQFHGGQMEQVLDDLVGIFYIRSPREALAILDELRKMGVYGKIDLCAEYVEGYIVNIKTF